MIFYFSATGNSQYIAQRIAHEMGTIALSIEHHDGQISLKPDDILGFVAPINWFELSILTRAFINKMSITGKPSYTFIVVTYGSTPGYSATDARHLLISHGITLDAAFSIRMPDNWTPLFDVSNKAKMRQLNEQANKHLTSVINSIKQRKKGQFTQRTLPYFLRYFTRPLLRYEQQTRFFRVESGCIGCGKCAANCPVKAITMSKNCPVWTKERCAICLRCLHNCPAFAIQYGKHTKRHGQYRHADYE